MDEWNIYKKFNSKKVISGSTQRSKFLFNDFSLAIHTGDNKLHINKNREFFLTHFSKFKAVTQKQIHSKKIVNIDKYDIINGWVELPTQADGFVTTKKGILLNIMTADCLSILAVDEDNGVVGAAHAGWRGTKEEISKNLINKMVALGAKLDNIKCAISPGICKNCYEVGEDVVDNFLDYPDAIFKKDNGKYLYDNLKVNISQLLELGVSLKNIETTNYCTSCDNDKFFSYRKGDIRGRFVSYIGLLP